MSTPYESMLGSYLNEQQGLAQVKQSQVAKASELKKKLLDPNYEAFNPDQYEVMDPDTIRNPVTKEVIRFQGQQGESLDAFETGPKTDPLTGEVIKPDVYGENPDRFAFHRRAYGKLFGKDPEDVSKEELYEFGELQTQRTRDKLESMRGTSMRRTGKDIYNRTLARFDDAGAFEHMQGQEGNAAYFAPSNYNRLGRDLASGELDELSRGSGDRSNVRAWTGDAAVNVLAGTGRMANEIAQSLATIGQINTEGVDEFFSNNRDRLDRFKENFSSKEQQYQDRMSQKRAALNPELFEMRKQKAIKAGMSETRASISAGVDELADSVEGLIENPGRILDATMESLPYMIGVGAVGRTVLNQSVKNLSKNLVKEFKPFVGKKAAKRMAEQSTELYKKSDAGKEALSRLATITGTTTVGLTEGLSASADVYDSIVSMTEEEAMQSEQYRNLRKNGMDHRAAVKELAEEAHWKTLGTVAAVAGTAGLLTGAAAFESKLFTRLGDLRKKKSSPVTVPGVTGTAAEVAKEQVKKKVPGYSKRALKATGRVVGELSKPGLKEAGEEAIQSGGGELLSQVFAKEATGKPIGPGVGAATGEGAVVGFASGAGAHAPSYVGKKVLGKAKDIVQAVKDETIGAKGGTFTDPSKIKIVPDTPSGGPASPPPGGGGGTTATSDSGGTGATTGASTGASAGTGTRAAAAPVGGSVGKVYAESKRNDYNPKESFASTAEQIAGTRGEDGSIDISNFNELKYHYDQLEKPEKRETDTFKAFEALYERRLTADVETILAKAKTDPASITDADRLILREANRRGFKAVKQAKLEGVTGQVLSHDSTISGIIDDIDQNAEEQLDLGKDLSSDPAAEERVIHEKLGDTQNKDGYLGLKAWDRKFAEDTANNDAEAFEKGVDEFTGFMNSQAKKAADLREIIKANKEGREYTGDSKYKYIQGKTERLLRTVEREQALMEKFLQETVRSYQAWNTNSTLSQKVIDLTQEEPEQKASKKKTKKKTSKKVEAAEKTEGEKTTKKKSKKKTAVKPAAAVPKEATAKQLDRAVNKLGLNKQWATASYDEVAIEITDLTGTKPDPESTHLELLEQLKIAQEETSNQKRGPRRVRERTAEVNAEFTEKQIYDARQLQERIDSVIYNIQQLENGGSVDDIYMGGKKPEGRWDQDWFEDGMALYDDAMLVLESMLGELEDLMERAYPGINLTESDVDPALVQSVIDAGKALVAPGNNEVDALPLPDYALPEEAVDTKAKEDNLRRKGIPPSIAAAYQRLSDKTKSILNAVADAGTALNSSKSRARIARALGLSPKEKSALDSFGFFRESFKITLEEILANPDWKGQRNNPLFMLKDSPFYLLSNDAVNEEGKLITELDDNVVTAMALEVFNWVSTEGPGTLNNTDEIINQFLNREEDTDVSAEEHQALHQGTLLTNVVSNMNTAIWKQLNLKNRTDVKYDNILNDRISYGLALASIATMIEMKLIQAKSIDAKWFEQHYEDNQNEVGQGGEGEGFEGSVILIHPTTDPEDKYKTSGRNVALQNAWRNGREVFEKMFGTATVGRMPLLTKPVAEDIPTKIRNSVANVAKKMRDYIGFNQERAWTTATPVLSVLKRFEGDEGKETFLELAHKYRRDFSMVHDSNRVRVESRNDTLMNDLNRALEWDDRFGGSDFYFTYFVTRSGRVHIDSNIINPQSSKIHRFLFTMKEWQRTIPVKKGKLNDQFMVAVASSLGIDAGKKKTKVILAELEKLIQEKDAQGNDTNFKKVLDIIARESTEAFTPAEIAIFRESNLLKNGTHALAGMVAYAAYRKARDSGAKTFESTLPMAIDGVTNGFSAGLLQTPPLEKSAQEITKNMLRATAVFFGADPHDFPTWLASGIPANKDNYQSVSHTVGVQLNNMKNGTYRPSKGRPVTDNLDIAERDDFIQANADQVYQSGFLPNLQELADMEGKVGRDWAKNPLMIVAYGAGLGSIIRKIISKANETFLEQLSDTNEFAENKELHAEKILDVLLRAANIIDVAEDGTQQTQTNKTKKRKKEIEDTELTVLLDYQTREEQIARLLASVKKDYGNDLSKFATSFKFGEGDQHYYDMGIRVTYGEALADTLHVKLQPIQKIREALNTANLLMNTIFVEEFSRRVEKQEKIYNAPLNRDDINKIIGEMYRQGLVPSIATPLSENVTENIETGKYGKEVLGHRQDGSNADADPARGRVHFEEAMQIYYEQYTAGKYGPQKGAEQRSLSSSIMAKWPISDVGVRAVVMAIHSIDGAVNGSAWGVHPALNLHDSVMTSVDTIDDIGRKLSMNFINTNKAYSLSEEIYKSTKRMMVLMEDNDFHMSKEQRDSVYKNFVDNLVNHDKSVIALRDNMTDREITNGFMVELQAQVENVAEARDNLFPQITGSNQYSKEEAGYTVGSETEGEIVERTSQEAERAERNAKEALKEKLRQAAQKDRDATVKTLVGNLDQGGFNSQQFSDALLRYIDEKKPSAAQMLEVLSAVFTEVNHPVAPTLRELNSLLSVHLKSRKNPSKYSARVFTSKNRQMNNPGDPGEYQLNKNIIVMNAKNDPNAVVTMIHEIIHAGTVNNLANLREENPVEFNRLYKSVIDRANKLLENKNPELVKMGRIIIALSTKPNPDPVGVISEYLAYTFSEGRRSDQYDLYFLNPAINKEGVNTLQRILRSSVANPKNGYVVMRSSQDEVSDQLFEESVAHMLEADKLQEIFNYASQVGLDDPNPEHREFLNNLINNFLIPGLKSIESLYAKLAINPNSNKNIGDINGNLIRVEAAGNQLTNNAEMSLHEVLAHEVTHAIVRAAIDGNQRLRKETIRLFLQARDQLTPEHFMPPADELVGDRDVALAAATERYNYIFRNSDGNQGYHEFMAIAMTNRAFATALSTIDDRDTRAPIWNGKVLSSIGNLFERMITWVVNQSWRKNRGSIAQSVQYLAHDMISFNQRNLVRVRNEDPNKGVMNRINAMDASVRDFIGNQLDKLERKLSIPEEERNAPREGWAEAARAGTHLMLTSRHERSQKALKDFINFMGITGNSTISEIVAETLPYEEDNLGTNEEKPGWIDLLRKSKLLVDTATQAMLEHTRSTLMNSFDPKKHITSAQRQALTAAVFKTDLSSLFENGQNITVGELMNYINNSSTVNAEMSRLEVELTAELARQDASSLRSIFNDQMNSLAKFMIKGEMGMEHGMKNAHNIVHQYYLLESDQVEILDPAKLIKLVEQITTLRAINLVPSNTQAMARAVIDHEMSRNDVEENGFRTMIGMHMNFKTVSKEISFDGNPIQMIKGYAHEMTDEDINLEFVEDTPEERQRMKDLGMVLVRPLERSKMDDPAAPNTLLYKGTRGLLGYNKAVVSLTDQHGRGSNLFASYLQDSVLGKRNLGRMKLNGFRLARAQLSNSLPDTGTHLVPILNEFGEIVDYSYVLSDADKVQHLKKKDPFDQVLPRMFSSITNRESTIDINRDVVKLLKEEWDTFKNDPTVRFIEIGQFAKTREAQEMYNLLPSDMKEALEDEFGGTSFPIRDNVVNLVMGFRKLSLSNNRYINASSPIAKTADKVWLEFIQYVRIKAAILTPTVVLGNIVSNFILLLSEGIPPSYIMKMTGEAMSGMRQYQKDIRARDTLEHKIGIAKSFKKPTTFMEIELARLNADMAHNPVGALVREGMFTNIVEDLGTNEYSLREQGLNKLADVAKGVIPKGALTLAKEIYMVPGSSTFNAALAATQYGDFIGRYVKFKHDTEVKKVPRLKAIHDSLATFIYYDIPQNKYLQFGNDYGFLMFTKFFLRIQPVIARLFTNNPGKAFGILAMQHALMPAPFNENIAKYALMQGASRKFEPLPLLHLEKIEPLNPSLFEWILGPFGF